MNRHWGKPLLLAPLLVVQGVACGNTSQDPGAGGGDGGTSAEAGSSGGGRPSTSGGGGAAGASLAPRGGAAGNESSGQGGVGGLEPQTGGTSPGGSDGGSNAEGGAAGEPSRGGGNQGGNLARGGAAGQGGAAGPGGAGQGGASAGAAGDNSLPDVGQEGVAVCAGLTCDVGFDRHCQWNSGAGTACCQTEAAACPVNVTSHFLRCDQSGDCSQEDCIFDRSANANGRAECSGALNTPQLTASRVIAQLCDPSSAGECTTGSCRSVVQQAVLNTLLPQNYFACY